MKFRTSYLLGLMATVLAVSSTTSFIDPAIAADTPKIKPLKIMGPDGQIRQVNHQYGPTTSKDTFWSIAQKVRPDASVSVYQVMAAVFDANPHAFNSDSYNSLERGMILLIPSKEVMLSIPNSVAIARAERSDKQVRNTAKVATKPVTKPITKPVVVTPVVENKPKVEVKPEVNKTEVAKTEVVATPPATPVVPKMASSDVNARLEAAESKNLSLTDELARAQDQLAVRNADVEALKAKIEDLNQQIAVLEETLQASKKQNLALKAEVEAAQAPSETDAQPQIPSEPEDVWRNLMNNPLLLVAAAVIPALLLLLLVFWMLRRKRNKERRELEAQQIAMTAGAAGMATGASVLAMDDDDINDMAVHLDGDHADSIDSLLDVGSVSLQPEQEMTDGHEQMDIASEMFIDSGASTEAAPQFEEDEGQSLDDLWAEAMGDQEETFAEEKPKSGNILEEEDLDALLAGLGSDVSHEPSTNAASDTDNFDELADFDIPSEPPAAIDSTDAELAAAIAAELESELENKPSAETADDDIDALLAGFNTSEVTDSATDSEADDLDALLADFGKTPAEATPELSDEIAAELDVDLTDIGVSESDDIDSLLASLDAPIQHDPVVAAAIAAELEEELNTELPVSDDDLDQLLAGFNAQDTAEVQTPGDINNGHSDEIAAELEATLPEELTAADDDLDSLLAEFDVPEQAEADADEFNFDLETTHLDTEDKAEEEDLLKGIGAAHAIDGTDDTFELSDTIADRRDDANEAADEPTFTGFADNETNNVELATATAAAAAAKVKEKEASFFNDLKANKSKDPHVLDWDTELNFAPTSSAKNEFPKSEPVAPVEPAPVDPQAVSARQPLEFVLDEPIKKVEPTFTVNTDKNDDIVDVDLGHEFDLKADLDTDDIDLTDDSVLAAFSANVDIEDEEVLTPEDSFALDEEHTLTVDEALAALDAQESRKSKKFVPEHDLTNFQNEHGYIDIEKLLNDAEQDNTETDLYPEMDVEMSDVGALIGDAAMIDVDDEENSVNAKLDLARAYIEIDDSDSAKALLREVQIDGNDRQQEEAARLLKEMS